MPSSAADLFRGAVSLAPGHQEADSRSASAASGMLIYAAVRVFSLAVAALLLRHGRFRGLHLSLVHLITSWDSGRYLVIAAHWYAYPPGYRYPDSILAWFPGYPAAIDTISWIPGVGVERAGFAVTVVAGLAAAWGLTRLGMALTGDRRLSLLMVAVWAVAPGSIVLSMLYSEALFCALAIWALVAITERRWLTAAGLAIGAGLVRSTGIAVAAAVMVAALTAVITALRARQSGAACWRPAAALLLSPLGVVGYWAYTVIRLRHLGGWAWLEHNGQNGFDWGKGVVLAVRTTLFGHPAAFLVMILFVLAIAVVLTLRSLAEKFPLSMHVYTVAVVVMAFGVGPFYLGSKPRFLLPAVLLSVPVARLLAPLPPWLLGLVIGLLGAASVWFSLFLISAGQAP
jgi:Gpi18-like mannosyltransferase